MKLFARSSAPRPLVSLFAFNDDDADARAAQEEELEPANGREQRLAEQIKCVKLTD